MISWRYAKGGLFAALLLPVALGGCALPLPVQIASWAIDGISYVATNKSVADHGISMAMDQDCALFRTVTEGHPCREGSNYEVDVAFLDTEDDDAADPAAAEADIAVLDEDLIEIETASGPAEEAPARVAEASAVAPSPVVEMPARTAAATPAETLDAVKHTVVAALQEGTNLFYVIGSFGSPERAERMAARHPDLDPSVMPVKVRSKEVYRVLVGPFRKDEMRAAGKRLHDHGVKNAWGVRVDPQDWRQARLEPGAPHHERTASLAVASLPQ